MGIPEKELPEILKLADAIHWFYEEYKDALPTNLTNEYLCQGAANEKNHSVYLPPLANVNICMTKWTHRKIFAAKKD